MQLQETMFTTTKGETLRIRSMGSPTSPVIVLLHGNLSSSANWIPTMETLSSSYRVYAPDLRGFGASTYYQSIDSVSDLAEDIIEWIQTESLSDIRLFGWSLGGGVALEVTRQIPEDIRQLFLVSSVGLNGYHGFDMNLSFPNLLQKRFLENNPIIRQLSYDLKNQYRLGVERSLKMSISLGKVSEPLQKKMLDEALMQRNIDDIYSALIDYQFMSDHCNKPIPRQIPIYILHGRRDILVPFKDAEETAAYFKDQAKLIVFDYGGHGLMNESFEEFIDIIKRLLNESF